MWKYLTKEQSHEFLLSLNLIENNWDDKKKLQILYTLSNNPEKHYTKFTINKRNGKKRTILEPDYLLKKVQKKLLNNVLNNISISTYATAYYKGADIKNNATPHLKNKTILKMDITDFFENITFEMIYINVFKAVYFPQPVKTLLTNICCYEGHLPQGAPTSSAISNIIMKPFDEYIGKYCKERDITYTRYCDDLIFSGNFNPNPVIKKVSSFLNIIGFNVNESKTKILGRNNQQIITGIVVNEKAQVQRTYRQNLRQEIYYCHKFGIKTHLKTTNNKITPDKYLQSLIGKINFILYINPEDQYFKNIKKTILKLKNTNEN